MSTVATFDDDVAFLSSHGADVLVLDTPSGGKLALSAKYQGRVMTSAVAAGAPSLGFVHRKFVAAGKTGTAFDNYGGEDRFWLGPEGGQFGLYFAPGKPYAFDAWQTPHEMQEGTWGVAREGAGVVFARRMRVVNHSGTAFTVDVRRVVRPLSANDAQADLGVAVPVGVAWVGYESDNTITNAGDAAWTEDKGLVSVWILGMFAPAKDAHVIVPFDPAGAGPVVNDRYFGKVPAERLAVHDDGASEASPRRGPHQGHGYLVLKADGEHRSKIGLGPARALRRGELQRLGAAAHDRAARPPAGRDEVREQHVGRAEGAVRRGRDQRVQRRSHGAGQAVARRLLRARDELPCCGARGGGVARARAPDVSLRRGAGSARGDREEGARRVARGAVATARPRAPSPRRSPLGTRPRRAWPSSSRT
jgi:hypothetical protein